MNSYFQIRGDSIECKLCPHNCKIGSGKTGICGVRKNSGEKIELLTYGVTTGIASDPIEKKPLYHFFPGKRILSIGSYGCNISCDFCQNSSISQVIPETFKPNTSAENIVNAAVTAQDNIGIAFTYNEPVIWYEFIRDISVRIKHEGLHTALISNGFMNSEPLIEMFDFMDAFNIDLKAFNTTFYRKLTGSDIEPVKSSLKQIARAGKHLEITSLIIPGQNDSLKDMELQSEWIAGELGKGIPLHLSRYFPRHLRKDQPTSELTLHKLFDIASKKLDYVYLGNLTTETGQTTFCPSCHSKVSQRSGYNVTHPTLDENGKCKVCGNLIYKYF
jgi:pyruvate formate lyase activating enzyme